MVAQKAFSHSILVTTDTVQTWTPRCFNELEASHFGAISQFAPELVILGTGAKQQFPSAAILHPMFDRHIGVEVMNTGAACRTYNIIAAEGRRVLAALLMIDE